MKIVIDDCIPELEKRIREAHPEINVTPLSRTEITPAAVRDADALVVRTHTRCDSALLEGSDVKLVATATIGKNHIDVPWCEARGIRTANAPGCNAPAVMQYVACALDAAGFNPAKDTLGVVGKGHIGSLIVELYRKAGGKVLVCDPPRAEAGMTDEEYLPLETLLENVDAVTFHVPLTFEGNGERHPTYHLMGWRNRIPRIVVNASRGAVLNPDMFEGAVSGETTLIIDTWPFEDEPAGREVFDVAGMVEIPFISTPHIAGYSLQGKQRATRKVIEALNETFGLHIATEGLADYGFEKRIPDLDTVTADYNPLEDSALFKANPEELEKLRNGYRLREESKTPSNKNC